MGHMANCNISEKLSDVCSCPTENPCRSCGGNGWDVDYVGLEMNPVQVDCPMCNGTGMNVLPAKSEK
jgi:DnaJ-class molecular chaperone